MINEEVPKIKSETTVVKAEPSEEAKIEIAKPVLITEETDNENGQNNVGDDFGIRAEALYDYQAGSLLIKNEINKNQNQTYSNWIFMFFFLSS